MKHIVLIGLPGVGKSTTGALLAELLDAPFFDIDRVISERAQRSIGDIFSEGGEAEFRALETKTVNALLLREQPSVLAPGGGWAAQGDNLASSRERATTFYLTAALTVAVDRALRSGMRPLLDPDPAARMARLFGERRSAYERADHTIETGDDPPDVLARRLAELARKSGAW